MHGISSCGKNAWLAAGACVILSQRARVRQNACDLIRIRMYLQDDGLDHYPLAIVQRVIDFVDGLTGRNVIFVDGAIACGKSTLLRGLVKKFNLSTQKRVRYVVEPSGLWNDLLTVNQGNIFPICNAGIQRQCFEIILADHPAKEPLADILIIERSPFNHFHLFFEDRTRADWIKLLPLLKEVSELIHSFDHVVFLFVQCDQLRTIASGIKREDEDQVFAPSTELAYRITENRMLYQMSCFINHRNTVRGFVNYGALRLLSKGSASECALFYTWPTSPREGLSFTVPIDFSNPIDVVGNVQELDYSTDWFRPIRRLTTNLILEGAFFAAR